MKYVGLHTQIRRNNTSSVLLLLTFPLIILGTVWVFLALTTGFETYYDQYGDPASNFDPAIANEAFVSIAPWVAGAVAVWFGVAYLGNAAMVRAATGSRPLSRRENPRVYNIVENLCMTCNMPMPQVCVVDDPQLNAFASGIDERSYAVTVTTGLMQRLDDDELAGVIAHELTHIRNRDTRVLITSIIFVGIISTVMTVITRMLYYNFVFGSNRRDKEGKSTAVVMVIALVCAAIAYFFTMLTRFAISRKREYMADAGGAELCGNPLALASALRKISGDPGLENVGREDIAQLYIAYPQSLSSGSLSILSSLFSTHPPIERRIQILEQF